jgi:N-acetylglutamate synthase-like GNAT family acetyltransferase
VRRNPRFQISNSNKLIELHYLVIHPDNQKKGVGTALMESGMRQAEKMGLDIFIHATKEGVWLYKRLGFHIGKEIIPDDSMYGGTGEHYTCFTTFEQNGVIF